MASGVSKVTIANLALSHLKAKDRIQDLNERGPEARECKLWYDVSRIATLEAFDWNFARKTKTLSLHADPAPTEWAYRYTLPMDYLSVRHLVNPAGKKAAPVPFELCASLDGASMTLCTDLDQAELVYTFDQQNVALFTMGFVISMSHHLAFNTALALTGKKDIRDAEMNFWRNSLQEASATDANQQREDLPPDTDWIRDR